MPQRRSDSGTYATHIQQISDRNVPQHVFTCKVVLLSKLLLTTPQTFLNKLPFNDFSGAGTLMRNERANEINEAYIDARDSYIGTEVAVPGND